MIDIGKINNLQVTKLVDFGVYLDGGKYDEILLPKRYVPKNLKVDDTIDVFIYLDSDDRFIATTETPKTHVNEFSYLQVVSVNNVGAFLDWGLPKDLFVPFREQKSPMEEGKYYAVYTYLDENSMRIAASSRVEKFLSKDECTLKRNDEVTLFMYDKTEMGYKAIINKTYHGLIFNEDIFGSLHLGETHTGYIKQIREDGKIDLTLQKMGYKKISGHADIILNKLNENNGFLPVTDKSKPEIISHYFGISKASYKKAVGSLYKARKIRLEKSGIKLV